MSDYYMMISEYYYEDEPETRPYDDELTDYYAAEEAYNKQLMMEEE